MQQVQPFMVSLIFATLESFASKSFFGSLYSVLRWAISSCIHMNLSSNTSAILISLVRLPPGYIDVTNITVTLPPLCQLQPDRVMISISAIDEKQADGTMDFPSVTICNVNSIRISKLSKEDIFHVGQFFGLIQNDGVSYFQAYFSAPKFMFHKIG